MDKHEIPINLVRNFNRHEAEEVAHKEVMALHKLVYSSSGEPLQQKTHPVFHYTAVACIDILAQLRAEYHSDNESEPTLGKDIWKRHSSEINIPVIRGVYDQKGIPADGGFAFNEGGRIARLLNELGNGYFRARVEPMKDENRVIHDKNPVIVLSYVDSQEPTKEK